MPAALVKVLEGFTKPLVPNHRSARDQSNKESCDPALLVANDVVVHTLAELGQGCNHRKLTTDAVAVHRTGYRSPSFRDSQVEQSIACLRKSKKLELRPKNPTDAWKAGRTWVSSSSEPSEPYLIRSFAKSAEWPLKPERPLKPESFLCRSLRSRECQSNHCDAHHRRHAQDAQNGARRTKGPSSAFEITAFDIICTFKREAAHPVGKYRPRPALQFSPIVKLCLFSSEASVAPIDGCDSCESSRSSCNS